MGRVRRCIIALVLVSAAGPLRAQVLNPSFEDASRMAPALPAVWFVSAPNRSLGLDSATAYHGRHSLRSSADGGGALSVANQRITGARVAGGEVALSGWIRTTDVHGGYAGLWLRADGAGSGPSAVLDLENMRDTGVFGTTEWTRYEIRMSIPAETEQLLAGVLHSGSGDAWFDAIELTITGVQDVVLEPTSAMLELLDRHSTPLQTVDPTDPLADLDRVAHVFDGARVIGLGEGTHGTREFFQMKHRIVRWFAERAGHGGRTVFAIEANMPEARRVNDYVVNGRGNARDAVAGMYFWTWNTEEVVALVEWMRQYNASGAGRIEFYGFDAQFPLVAADSVVAFLARVDPQAAATARSAYASVRATWAAADSARARPEQGPALRARLDAQAVLELIERQRRRYGALADSADVDWAVQNARVVFQSVAPMSGAPSRDQSMADNIAWIVARQPVETQIVLWAHNGHIQRAGNWMGAHLARRFGDEYLPVGFAFGSGAYRAFSGGVLGPQVEGPPRPGSFEHLVARNGHRFALIDVRAMGMQADTEWLRRPVPMRMIGAAVSDDPYRESRIADAFDAIVYVDRTTASQPARGEGD